MKLLICQKEWLKENGGPWDIYAENGDGLILQVNNFKYLKPIIKLLKSLPEPTMTCPTPTPETPANLPYSRLKEEVGRWSEYNFGQQGSKHPNYQLRIAHLEGEIGSIEQNLGIFQGNQNNWEHETRVVNLGSIAPLLGINEEYHEYISARAADNHGEVLDALADMGIYLMDFMYREGVSTNEYTFDNNPNLMPQTLSESIGKLTHAVLKYHQGIRPKAEGYQETLAKQCFHIRKCLENIAAAAVVQLLKSKMPVNVKYRETSPLFSKEDNTTNYLDILNHVWRTEVQPRDWKKYPKNGRSE